MKTTKVFDKLLEAWIQHWRIIDNEGGTRSSKTYSVLQLLSLYAPSTKKPVIVSVVSETIPHLKKGAIRDFKQIMRDDGRWNEDNWSATEHICTFENGSIIEFFSADAPAKVHGPARDVLFINECQNISYEVYRQLAVRTRDRIILDYNPTHHFWVHDHIKPGNDCKSIHSTYKDNNFLTTFQVREIEKNKDDKNWWRVYGEGKEGQLKGLIYDFELIDELPIYADGLSDIYGMDFGFTNDPTALVHIKADTGKKIIYAEEEIYSTGLLNSDICRLMEDKGVKKVRRPIYADCAEPKSIAEIQRQGFNVIACDKDAPVKSDKLKFQIQWLQGWKLKVTKRSVNMIKELRNYTWAEDANGNLLNYPIDKWNHALDALRYAAWTHFGQRIKPRFK